MGQTTDVSITAVGQWAQCCHKSMCPKAAKHISGVGAGIFVLCHFLKLSCNQSCLVPAIISIDSTSFARTPNRVVPSLLLHNGYQRFLSSFATEHCWQVKLTTHIIWLCCMLAASHEVAWHAPSCTWFQHPEMMLGVQKTVFNMFSLTVYECEIAHVHILLAYSA